MQLRIHQFDLPLKHRFTIARGSAIVQPTLIVELVEDGHHGYGEATVNPYYGATYDAMIAAIESVRTQVEAATLTEPLVLWSELAARLAADRSQVFGDLPSVRTLRVEDSRAESGVGSPPKALDPRSSLLAPRACFALCALDEAAHDLWGKKRGAPVYRLWGLSTDKVPASNFTIGIDSVDRMVEKLLEMPGWPIYKIKLGTAQDLAIVRELRRHTDAVFRVDANCGWTVGETLRNAAGLAALGVEFVEQPLPADDWAGHRRLFEESPLPIIADESCVSESDVERCHGHYHGINIKLTKCGGLTPARRMIERARALGLRVMIGCMTESSVGISAIAQLLPLLDYVDMDGAALLARDVATGVRLDHGRCIYADENGTGARLIAS